MIRKEKIKKAHEDFKNVMIQEFAKPGDGGYFAVSMTEKDGMGVSFGGRVDLIGIGLAHALAKYVQVTPGIDGEFIKLVAETAKDLCEGGGKVQ